MVFNDFLIYKFYNSLVAFPDFNKIIETYNAKGTYTIPSDGYLVGYLGIKNDGISIKATLNDAIVCYVVGASTSRNLVDAVGIPVKAGTVLIISSDVSSGLTIDLKLCGLLK